LPRSKLLAASGVVPRERSADACLPKQPDAQSGFWGGPPV